MKKNEISFREFDNLDRVTRLGNIVRVKDLIEIHEYLKDKIVIEKDKLILKRYPANDFIVNALFRVRYAPKFSEAVSDFIKSDYLSDCLKENIYYILSKIEGYEDILDELKTDCYLGNFNFVKIIKIYEGLSEYYSDCVNELTESNNLAYDCFTQYMFFQDSNDAKTFIKQINNNDTLFKDILANSGVIPTSINYVSLGLDRCYLNEDHLISIYEKIKKFYPGVEEEFAKLVMMMDDLSPNIFIINYFNFVNSNFIASETNIINKKIVKKELHRRNMQTIFKNKQNALYNEWQKKQNLNNTFIIKSRFEDYINNLNGKVKKKEIL